jgi:hypothetical protein
LVCIENLGAAEIQNQYLNEPQLQDAEFGGTKECKDTMIVHS